MRSWIHLTRGRHVRQARVGLGDLREEHISRQGFFGPVAMIYREHGPNEVVRIEGTLHPRRVVDTTRVEPSDQTDPRGLPEVLLSNADVSVGDQPARRGDAVRLSQHRRRPVVFRAPGQWAVRHRVRPAAV